jgi:hypothetical protein
MGNVRKLFHPPACANTAAPPLPRRPPGREVTEPQPPSPAVHITPPYLRISEGAVPFVRYDYFRPQAQPDGDAPPPLDADQAA